MGKHIRVALIALITAISVLPATALISCAPSRQPSTSQGKTVRYPVYLEVVRLPGIDAAFAEDLKSSIEENLNYRGYAVVSESNLPTLKVVIEKYGITPLDYTPAGEVKSYQVSATIEVTLLSSQGKKTKTFTESSIFSNKTIPPKSEEEAVQEVIESLSQDAVSFLP